MIAVFNVCLVVEVGGVADVFEIRFWISKMCGNSLALAPLLLT